MAGAQEDLWARGAGVNSILPKVTAIVPSYNHGKYIRERIESIVNQTYTNIELIVIDDRSPDESHRIITELQEKHGFRYYPNKRNTGTPFSAWERACALASGDYIWICESDDVAEATFLETAVGALLANPGTVMFYSSSRVIDEHGAFIGHTDSYFHEIWRSDRWDHDFCVEGMAELLDFQVRGQTVPNMSSALFTADSFRAAFSPFLRRLKLTGDWLLVGEVMKHGKVIYTHQALSRFRKHKSTARVRVPSARSQAEFILTKYRLFRGAGARAPQFSYLMSSDVVRFLYEPDKWYQVVGALLQISVRDTIGFALRFALSLLGRKDLLHKFVERYRHAKSLEPS